MKTDDAMPTDDTLQTYDVIATLGPATRSEDHWTALLDAGANRFRLNTSHMTIAETGSWVDALREFLEATDRPDVGIVLDLQGSKWRIGPIRPITVEAGDRLTLSAGEDGEDATVIPVPHEAFFRAVEASNGEVRLNDGKVILKVSGRGSAGRANPPVDDRSIEATVVRGGPLSGGKGITVPGTEHRNEGLGEKDRELLSRWCGRTAFAVSYVKDAVEMERFRGEAGPEAVLIAKLERQSALADVEGIVAYTNELWLCRGDLGAELGFAEMAAAVRRFRPIRTVPSILAGQVLEHMTEHPTPTRSEVCYLYDALHAGFRGVVLSDETAVGQYPIEACRTASLFRPVPPSSERS